jgi:DNA-binding beta-propeller fold protein YncE
VINPLTNAVTSYVPDPGSPYDVAINPLTGRAYVPNFDSDTVAVIGS